jgi:hypothetical protein
MKIKSLKSCITPFFIISLSLFFVMLTFKKREKKQQYIFMYLYRQKVKESPSF